MQENWFSPHFDHRFGELGCQLAHPCAATSSKQNGFIDPGHVRSLRCTDQRACRRIVFNDEARMNDQTRIDEKKRWLLIDQLINRPRSDRSTFALISPSESSSITAC